MNTLIKYAKIELVPTRRVQELYPKVCFETLSEICNILYNSWVPSTARPLMINHKIKLQLLKGKNNRKKFDGLCYTDSNLIEINPKMPFNRFFKCIIHEFRHWYQSKYLGITMTPYSIACQLSDSTYLDLPEEKDANSLEEIYEEILFTYTTIKSLKQIATHYTKFSPN